MNDAVEEGARVHGKRRGLWRRMGRNIREKYELYLFVLPALLAIILFHYVPIYGLQIAFKDFSPALGIIKSPWAGLKHFSRFWNSYQFGTVLKNTLILAFYQIAVTFPVPIVLALLIHQMRDGRLKKTTQTVFFIPHFISTVVIVGMLTVFLSPRHGIVNAFMSMLGGSRVHFMGQERWFRRLYILSDIWANAGWESVIFISTLSGVDPTYYEAAKIDGASRWQRIRHIDLPMLRPTILIIFIMKTGYILNSGGTALSPAFEKVYLMQNDLNLGVSEIISTYVYKIGLQSLQYSYSTAIGLFNTGISYLVVLGLNALSRRFNDGAGLW